MALRDLASSPPTAADSAPFLALRSSTLTILRKKIDRDTALLKRLSNIPLFPLPEPIQHPYVTPYQFGPKTFDNNLTFISIKSRELPPGAIYTNDPAKQAWLCQRHGKQHMWGQAILPAARKTCFICGNEKERGPHELTDYEIPGQDFFINTSVFSGNKWVPPPLSSEEKLKSKRPWKYQQRAAADLYWQLRAAGIGHTIAKDHCRRPFHAVSSMKHTEDFKAWLRDTAEDKLPNVDDPSDHEPYPDDPSEDEDDEGDSSNSGPGADSGQNTGMEALDQGSPSPTTGRTEEEGTEEEGAEMEEVSEQGSITARAEGSMMSWSASQGSEQDTAMGLEQEESHSGTRSSLESTEGGLERDGDSNRGYGRRASPVSALADTEMRSQSSDHSTDDDLAPPDGPSLEDTEEEARLDKENRRKWREHLEKLNWQTRGGPTIPIQGDVSDIKPPFQGRDVKNFEEDVNRTIDEYRSRDDRLWLEHLVEITTATIALVRDRHNILGVYRLRKYILERDDPRPCVPIGDEDITEAKELISSVQGKLDVVYKRIWRELLTEHWD